MRTLGQFVLIGSMVALLAWPGRLWGHGAVEHRKHLPDIKKTRVGPYEVSISVQGGVLRKDVEGWITAKIDEVKVDKKTRKVSKKPLTKATVFIILPHEHASTEEEFKEYNAKYGPFDNIEHNRELLDANIAETGNAMTEESDPGSYSIRFTPTFAATHEVHVLILVVGGKPLPKPLEALLTTPVRP
ncbi:MAG: hypothetical protein HY347_03440 [candidate division NC10 bacterium]|nr:hypothetical protein [candidate division NC10 bacterium]